MSVAQDKAADRARSYVAPSAGMAHLSNLKTTTKFTNFEKLVEYPYGDSSSGPLKRVVIYTRNSPVGDADYAGLPIGSECYQITVASLAATSAVKWLKVGATTWASMGGVAIVADPGDAAAIPVTTEGNVVLVSAGAETRTLAIPLYKNQRMIISMGTDAGDVVLTVASAIDQNGSTVVTFNDVGDYISLEAVVTTGTTLGWRTVAADGVLIGDATHKGMLIADPGASGAIVVTQSGWCPIVTAAGETRTLAVPTFAGQRIALTMKTDVGDATITVASAFDSNGSTVIVMNDAGDTIVLEGVYSGASLAWRMVSNNGCLVGDATHKGLLIADPGDGNAIVVTQSGWCPLVSAGAETRTLAVPTFAGQKIVLSHKTDSGDIVVTVAQAFDQNGSTRITFNDAGDTITLIGMYSGANLRWRIVQQDGVLTGDATHWGKMIVDPADGNAIVVTQSGFCPLVSGGAETRTMAAPTFLGQLITLGFKTDGGNCVVTIASTVNQTGNNTLTFADIGDEITLRGCITASAMEWREVSNDGVALTTV